MFTPKLLLTALIVLLAIILLPALANPKYFRKSVKGFMTNINFIRITALINLIIGFLFLSVHWKLTNEWLMTISIIGWLAVLKGIVYFWFPEFIKKRAKKTILKSDKFVSIWAFFGVVLTVILAYITFNLIGPVEIIGA